MSVTPSDAATANPDAERGPPLQRVAILGAGPAALAAAMALAETRRYRVDVYQMGGRAGGKSGTARAAGSLRAEQNGSHYLFGCYENAFVLLRKAHDIIRGSGTDAHCFGGYEEDLLPTNLLVSKQLYAHVEESGAGDWFRHIPQNMAFPGDGKKFPSAFDYLLMAAQVGLAIALDAIVALLPPWREDRFAGVRVCLWLFPVCPMETGLRARLTRMALTPLRWLVNACWAVLAALTRALLPLAVLVVPDAVLRALRRFSSFLARRGLALLRCITSRLYDVSRHLPLALSRMLQRRLILVDFGVTLLRGFYVDGLHRPGGFAKIDRYDFRDWLRRHGARPETRDCAMIRTWYDAIVSYEDGDPERPRCSAALAVHSLLRSLLTYKGAFAYQLRAEVGDSFVAPIVRALELRGVRFHFYERVESVTVDRRRGLVTHVALAVQRHVQAPGAQFIDVEDRKTKRKRKAWPAEADAVASNGVPSFDSYYCDRKVGERHLALSSDDAEADADDRFDSVICALPLHVVEDVLTDTDGRRIADSSSYWSDCFARVAFVESQALRIWFRIPLKAENSADGRSLGWTHAPPIVSGYHPPHSTWEDDSRATHVHAFPDEQTPHTIATLFGPLPTGAEDIRHVRHLHAQQAAAKRAAERFLDEHMLPLWPGLRRADGSTDWDAFIDLDGRSQRARFDWQHVIANVGPNENYILCLPGTLRHRLRPDESGFKNMYLAGDWTRNGVEVGTIEGAVVSGYKAARALSGSPREIIGESDIEFGEVFAA